jgi:hypothetical protein
MPEFRHSSSLAKKPGFIRLLRLLPENNDEGQIQCELVEYNLRGSSKVTHPYEALSYFWGDQDNRQYIVVDNQKLAVGQNLYGALSRLRDHDFTRILWIDAICIDQQNDKEKEAQIQMMALIYAQARCVLVWLGEAADGSDQVLEKIRLASLRVPEYPNDVGEKVIDEEIPALLIRPWFKRMWVRETYFA